MPLEKAILLGERLLHPVAAIDQPGHDVTDGAGMVLGIGVARLRGEPQGSKVLPQPRERPVVQEPGDVE